VNSKDILHRLQNVKKVGSGWTARCPTHDDQHNSLSITDGDDGRLLLHCHANAGCTYAGIMRAVGIPSLNGSGSAQSEKDGYRPDSEATFIYDYRDEQGAVLYQALRFDHPKDFRPRVPDGRGGFVRGLPKSVRRVPYRLPELLAGEKQTTVFIVEGEKDADRLAALGLVATTNVGGAGKWRDEYNEPLRGRHVVVLPDNDEPGRNHAARVMRSLQRVAASVRVVHLPGLPEKGDVTDWLAADGTIEKLLEIVKRLPKEADSAPLKVVRMADVEPETVAWLWHPYIARGKLTILEGDPGLGKSWLTCALACAVSHGRGLPNAEPFTPGNVLMLSAEDGLGDTLRPRLDAVGADVSRVFALDEPLTFDSGGLLKLEASIIEHAPLLVIIDPLFAFTGGKVDIHRANECRAISAPLAAIAERQGCALVAIRHLSKSRGGGHALNAGIGSIDFAAAARSVLLVGRDPDDEMKRAVVQTKNNLAPHGAAIGYTLEGGCFYWTGESDLTAERILAAASDDEERSTITEAVDFLRTALSAGARDSKAVKAEAKDGGISAATLRRAQKRLKVRAKKVGLPGSQYQKWVWALSAPEGAQVAAEGAQKTEVEHLRASEPNKDSYGNNLAEGAQLSKFEHLREQVEHLRESDEPLDDEQAERAAIMEVDGRLSPEEAERLARAGTGGLVEYAPGKYF